MSSAPQQSNVQVSRFCWQCLQLEPAPDFPDGELLREGEVQETIHQWLFADAVAPGPPRRYQLRVLKELLARIERAIEDWDRHGISDNLMCAMSDLLSQPLPSEADAAQQRCHVTYHLSLLQTRMGGINPHISLLESRSLIAASGTTGLRTWEAALHLGQYLCANPALVANKNILELGAGTGYLAVLCAKYLGSNHVIASDGSDEVVEKLADSYFLNGLQGSEVSKVMVLKWGHALLGIEEQAWNGGRRLDTVLGADITYDERAIPALVATLEELEALFPGIRILIAATERNKATFESFLALCGGRGFAVMREPYPVPRRSDQHGPFYSDDSPIHICKLTK